MLLDEPIKPGSIVSVKLTSGEELVARFGEETTTHLVLEKVAMIGHNQQGLGLAPWIMTSNTSKVRLNLSCVIAYVPTESDIAKAYQSSTSDITIV